MSYVLRSLIGLTLTITLPTMVGLIGLFLPRALVWEGGGGARVRIYSFHSSLTCGKKMCFLTLEGTQVRNYAL